MDSWYGRLLTSVFILPFTAGNYRRRSNGSGYYDGGISSRVLFLVVLGIVIVFLATKSVPTHFDQRLGLVVTLLSLLITVALIGICFTGYRVRKYGISSVVAKRRNSNTSRLQVIFLWVFGLSSALSCVLFVGKQIECLFITGRFYWNALLCFNVLAILGFIIQLIFITYFSSFKLKNTVSVNYVMGLLFSANIFVIVYVYMIGDTILNLKIVDYEANLTSCLYKNSTMTFLKVQLGRFLEPTYIEYGLLSTEVILEIWSLIKNHYPETESPYTRISGKESTDLSEDLTLNEIPYMENGSRNVCNLITLAVSLTTGLGLVVCYIASDSYKSRTVEQIRVYYEFILTVVMVIALFVGFYCLVSYCTPDKSFKGLKAREYVYLLSAFGMIMMDIFEGIVGDISNGSIASPNLLLVSSSVSVFQDYIQVIFLLYANRCSKKDPQSNITFLQSIFIFIMINNFILWFIDSFFFHKSSSIWMQKYDQLPKSVFNVIFYILLPVSIYFRFTSSMEYYAAYGKYRNQLIITRSV